jgi:hypothetical protein
MKKLVILLVFVIGFLSVNAQNAYVRGPKHIQGWGNASVDTLTAAVTKNYIVRVKSADLLKLHVGMSTDSVSGTPAYTATLYGSMDGSYYTSIQAVTTTTGVDTGFVYTAVDATYNYYKLAVVGAAGAQKSTLSCSWAFRKKND